MELLGFLEVGFLDLTLSSSFLKVEQSVEINPGRPQVFLLRLSQ